MLKWVQTAIFKIYYLIPAYLQLTCALYKNKYTKQPKNDISSIQNRVSTYTQQFLKSPPNNISFLPKSVFIFPI